MKFNFNRDKPRVVRAVFNKGDAVISRCAIGVEEFTKPHFQELCLSVTAHPYTLYIQARGVTLLRKPRWLGNNFWSPPSTLLTDIKL